MLEISAHLRSLIHLRDQDPTLLGGHKFLYQGERLPPEEFLFRQFLRLDGAKLQDRTLERVSRGDGSFFPAFAAFVDLPARSPDLLARVEGAVNTSIFLDEARPETLLCLALLAQAVTVKPELEDRLNELLALARSDDYQTIRSLKEQLYRRQEVERRSQHLAEVPWPELGQRTSMLLQACERTRREIPLTDKTQQVLARWAERVEQLPSWSGLPEAFEDPRTAFDHFRFLEQHGRVDTWPRLVTYSQLCTDPEAAREVMRLDLKVRSQFGEKSFDEHWPAFESHLREHDWDPVAGWELYEVYAQSHQAGPSQVDLDIDLDHLRIGDIVIEVES